MYAIIDGNEAAARVAHRLSEVIAIYPITPASPMGELADEWSTRGETNLWGTVPEVVEMQSEAGAAGALHGAVQAGALATTFTASQGLLLMLPNMFKIAGELTPTVIHVAARTVATHALSIFGDHSDVMAARSTGFAMLAASSVQEAHDFAAVAHAVTLRSRVPFLHFFDGFRTSHEMGRVALLDDSDLHALIDERAVLAHRALRLTPDAPVLRGTAQNPDVFFQAREAANPHYDAVPGIVQEVMDELAARTGRHYHAVDYVGSTTAEHVLVLMGSGCGAARECVADLASRGDPVGLVTIRLYRPFPASALAAALPDTARRVAVLDRTKEPGAVGEPLYLDVVAALHAGGRGDVDVLGGRYGLSSKEFTPAMVKGVLDSLVRADTPRPFTVGIVDDVTHTSVPPDPDYTLEGGEIRAVFYGLGADGTVGACKATTKIIGEGTELHPQAYFVYDSKKSGSITVSHLRFGPDPITSTYLVERATFVACHQFQFLERIDVLACAADGATFLLNSPHGPGEVWDHLPREVQETIIAKRLHFFVIDAHSVAREAGMGARINTVMQPCFFALAGVLPRDEAVAKIKDHVERMYARRGRPIVERNHAAIDAALHALHEVSVPTAVTATSGRLPPVPADAPDFVQRVTGRILEGQGDLLPVSALPVDGTFPTGTARWEKRMIAHEIPIWDPDICIDCGKCAIACPHAAIRMKVYAPSTLEDLDAEVLTKPFRSKEISGYNVTIQVAPDDCTGCGVCVDVCPAKNKAEVRLKAINMRPAATHRMQERVRFDAFLCIPEAAPDLLEPGTVKGSQVREPLFEYSGACAGCGETPYLKLLTQLFGDRIVIANATGCSSIYGANLPTTPWTTNAAGRGPAWSNSLFEDNAEFGLGMRLALESHLHEATRLLHDLAPLVGEDLARTILEAPQTSSVEIETQRRLVEDLQGHLAGVGGEAAGQAARLDSIADDLVRKSVWIVGGDGWAYDIGYGGLDHVLASGRDLNILVLDTEVYSNTGGQASKATPRAAVAKFAAAGKATGKKDLGMIATQYGDVYVAHVALGANDVQTVKAFVEADEWPGPSLVIAYSTCIAHGIDMATSMSHQKDAVRSGYWPLYRYHPGADEHARPFKLDSKSPSIPFREFAAKEARFAMLERVDPERARELADLAQADIDERWRLYDQMTDIERTVIGTEREEDWD
ncbi:MAG: pyruvate:ferredoxin (flavodoxin) oxidoreductase [Acidimicrobiia bacterium]|nr:pyruvate:ferredoxin (flavodoxin) oxidoreductase [Acidimicrobiia bacterium]